MAVFLSQLSWTCGCGNKSSPYDLCHHLWHSHQGPAHVSSCLIEVLLRCSADISKSVWPKRALPPVFPILINRPTIYTISQAKSVWVTLYSSLSLNHQVLSALDHQVLLALSLNYTLNPSVSVHVHWSLLRQSHFASCLDNHDTFWWIFLLPTQTSTMNSSLTTTVIFIQTWIRPYIHVLQTLCIS